MRVRAIDQGLTLQAIAGTHVVILGFDRAEADCDGLLGFAIHRTDHTEDEAYWLRGLKTFAATDPGRPPGSTYSTRQHPIQGFSWSDLTAKPEHDYSYRVVALHGSPEDLRPAAEVSVRVQTESPAGQVHHVTFNRGAAASQEYARRFGSRRPEEVGPAAFTWLSRGLYESMIAFAERATGTRHELRVCAYEFHYPPFLLALHAAIDRGVTVRIVYDRRKDTPGSKNESAVAAAALEGVSIKRRANPTAISHNKFIVLLEDGAPLAVLTGGTNFSEGGIFGHSNCVHVVNDPAVAATYGRYWQLLASDPTYGALKPAVLAESPVPAGDPPIGATAIFSPRRGLGALERYAALARGARDSLFMTFAFGMHDLFQEVYRSGTAPLRYALLEKTTRPMKEGPEREAEERKIALLRFKEENRFAVGAHLRMNMFDRWLGEQLSGLNSAVQYLHTKYMLVDPLGPDPLVITGSANFSEASTEDNDENMLIVRGHRRSAHIYLGEFMRLYNHFAFREWASKQRAPAIASPSHLRLDRWWAEYFGTGARSRQREYFASPEAEA